MLRNITLSILKREPMSGIELMEEIEEYTDWRPSPGSIYPLLSSFEKRGLIKPIESDDPSLKRYALTQSGITALEEHRKLEPHIRSRFYSIQKIRWILFEGMDEGLFESQSRLLKTIEKINPLLKSSPEASSNVQKLLQEVTEKVEEIHRQLVKLE